MDLHSNGLRLQATNHIQPSVQLLSLQKVQQVVVSLSMPDQK